MTNVKLRDWQGNKISETEGRVEGLSIIPGNMTLLLKQPISHQMLFDIAEALMHLVEKMALVLRIKENVSLEEGSL